ncbi:hypothetical protein [Dinoroseobacter shibae]
MTKIICVLSLAFFVMSLTPTVSVAVEGSPLTFEEICAEDNSGHAALVTDQQERHDTACFGSVAHCSIISTTPPTPYAPSLVTTFDAQKLGAQSAESRTLEVKSPPPRS